ncbi:MAG: carboxypeptidase regulatory-like domain-containing protein [Terriglobales bacterium]
MQTELIRYLLNVVRSFFWMLFFAAILEAQAPSTSPQQSPNAGSYRVSGTVGSAVDGRPLARANIFLTDTKDAKNKQGTVSTDTGYFAFNRVAKGKYSLEGAKRGFISQDYNQHEQFSTAIVTGADVPTEDLLLRLPPEAVISVRVTDESSEPVRKGSVMLYREDRSTGLRHVVGVESRQTDDLGSCEFARLAPGVYFVGVTASPWYGVHPATVRRDGEEDPSTAELRSFDVAYPPTYYGDVTEADSATPIAVKPGDQFQAEIHLSPVQALHLVFRAAGDGQHGFTMPSLQKSGFDGEQLNPLIETRNISPNSFEIVGISPGRYQVSWPGSAPREVDIGNNGQDLSDAKGEPFSTVKASVRVLGDAKLPGPILIQLRPADERTGTVQARVDEKGQATFENVIPHNYNVFASTFGAAGLKPYSVVQISSQDGATAGPSLNVPPGSSLSVSLSLVSGMMTVEGFARRAGKPVAGAMIVLVPENPDQNRALFRRDQSDLDGSFSLQGVVPGSYTAVAIEDGWDMDWSLPALIESYVKNGKPITVADQPGHSMQLNGAVEVQPHH